MEGARHAFPHMPPSGSTRCLADSGLKFGAVPGNPVVLLTYLPCCARGVQPRHGWIARGSLDATPAAVLPPQDRVDDGLAVSEP